MKTKITVATIFVLLLILASTTVLAENSFDEIGGYPAPVTDTPDPYPILSPTPFDPPDYPAPPTLTPKPTATRNLLFKNTPTGSVTPTSSATVAGYPVPATVAGYPVPETGGGYPVPAAVSAYSVPETTDENDYSYSASEPTPGKKTGFRVIIKTVLTFIKHAFGKMIFWIQ